MHVITQKRIQDAKTAHPECQSALDGWLRIMQKQSFNNFSELKNTFSSVDCVNGKYVFDVGGNKLRIIASIHFNAQRIFILDVLAHAEYDKGRWKLDN